MQEIIVATGNKGKLREIGELLFDLPVTLSSLADYWNPIPVIPETGSTFLENALQKAAWVFSQKSVEGKNRWILADDSGLEVDALGGMPGIRSARFDGENADYEANNRKLMKLLEGIAPERRTARFTCVVALCTSADSYFSAVGTCEGTIGFAPRGVKGFGYDPLFIPAGFSRTFAELEPEEKHAISHRGKALKKVKNHCYELLG
ncbi:MAG: RdgB/HAM1 family non-canonical purine NTP pyrophosphatase [Chitinispirillaceae bacterium]|jgi:XTP/dITP diphosphohydrolase